MICLIAVALALAEIWNSVLLKYFPIIAALALAGCSSGSSLLSPKSGVPDASQVATGNNLAVPPDLQLARPTATTDAYQPNAPVAAQGPQTVYDTVDVENATPDVYAKYGVSRFKPNGKLKTVAEMKAELRQRILLYKRQQNPQYGTIGNIGNVLSGKDPVIMNP